MLLLAVITHSQYPQCIPLPLSVVDSQLSGDESCEVTQTISVCEKAFILRLLPSSSLCVRSCKRVPLSRVDVCITAPEQLRVNLADMEKTIELFLRVIRPLV